MKIDDNEPLVSVIVPCYNQAHFLPETLDSILAQTYAKWECLIVNDGSPDNTKDVAKEYCDKDTRFKYLHKQNGGLSSARNKGLAAAQGKYIQFLDSDDIIAPTKILESIDVFERTGADIVYTDFDKFAYDINDRIQNRTRVKLLDKPINDLLHNWDRLVIIPPHAIIYRRSSIDCYMFDENLPAKEDFDFIVRVFDGAQIFFIDSKLCSYRNTGNSLSYNISKMMTGTYRVQKRHFSRFGLWRKLMIIDNLVYRLGDWTIQSLIMRKNLLWQHLRVWLFEWRKDKSWLIIAVLLLPLGVIEKLCIVFYNRVLKRQ